MKKHSISYYYLFTKQKNEITERKTYMNMNMNLFINSLTRADIKQVAQVTGQ